MFILARFTCLRTHKTYTTTSQHIFSLSFGRVHVFINSGVYPRRNTSLGELHKIWYSHINSSQTKSKSDCLHNIYSHNILNPCVRLFVCIHIPAIKCPFSVPVINTIFIKYPLIMIFTYCHLLFHYSFYDSIWTKIYTLLFLYEGGIINSIFQILKKVYISIITVVIRWEYFQIWKGWLFIMK